MLIVGPTICEVGKCAHGCTMETGGCKGTEWRLNHAEQYLRDSIKQLQEEAASWGFTLLASYARPDGSTHGVTACWCASCNPDAIRMFVCPDCGCKRCPRAESHDATCTGKLVQANTPSGVTHTCSGCEENRARLDAAVQAPHGVSGGQHQTFAHTDADGSSLDAIPQEPK